MTTIRRWRRRVGRVVVTFLRGWMLNRVVAILPFDRVRHGYYRGICGMTIGQESTIWTGARFTGEALDRITVGARCSIGYDSFWVAGAAITLEDDVVTGHRVEFYTSDHDPDDSAFSRRDEPIRIESYVWIGSGAMMLKGVTIGRAAVVAAGSVVTKDVAPFTIVAGNPARLLRRRNVDDAALIAATRARSRPGGPLPD
jgi:acetyltransferase-like isoleucine patch superfamily enzyme